MNPIKSILEDEKIGLNKKLSPILDAKKKTKQKTKKQKQKQKQKQNKNAEPCKWVRQEKAYMSSL